MPKRANDTVFERLFLRRTPWKTMTIPIIIICMATVIFFSALYHLNKSSSQQVLNEFIYAARTGNIHAISRRTDWGALRQSMKQDLKRRAASHLGEITGHAMTPEAVDAMVDYYVTPANIPTLFYYRNTYAQDINPSDFIRRAYFTSLSQFVVEMGYPPQGDKPWVSYLEPVRLVFELEGMEWRLKNIVPPLYVVPTDAPSTVRLRARLAEHLPAKTDKKPPVVNNK
jgi:hypothetical protein